MLYETTERGHRENCGVGAELVGDEEVEGSGRECNDVLSLSRFVGVT